MQFTTRHGALLAGLILMVSTATAQPEPPLKEGKTVREWAERLQSRDLDEQRIAALSLSKLGRESLGALKELRGALSAKDNAVRFYAMRAIANGGPAAKAAIPDIVRIVEEDHPLLARPAALSLAQLGKDVVAPASKLLDHPNPRIRRNAVLTLGKLGGLAETAYPAIFKRLTDDESFLVRRRVAESLEQNPINTPAARMALVKAIRSDSDPDVAASAALSLGKLGTEALPDLLKLLDDPSADTRYHAALALRQLRSEAVPAVKALAKLLTEQDAELRQAATRALAAIGEPALPALMKTLEDPKPELREGALIGLTEMGTSASRALKPILAALDDKEITVARQAALALGAIADAQGVKPLIKALESRDAVLRSNAAQSLGRLGPAAAEAVPGLAGLLRSGNREQRDRSALALLQIGKASRPGLQKLLVEKEPRVRILSLIVLGRLGGSEAVADIAARLKDADVEVQLFAARALRELGRDASSAREALQAALTATKDPEVRKEIVEALAAISSSPKD